jgi:hypothetical protein
MPVPPVGEVGLLAHEAIGAPRDNVCLARGNVEPTAGAQIHLLRGNGRDVLHVPRSAALLDRASKPHRDAVEVERGIRFDGASATTVPISARSIASGHGC